MMTQTARYVFKQLLSDTHLNIIEAADGREGIHLAQVEKPDCIVLDLSLPEMSGVRGAIAAQKRLYN
jgi:CheY-like chemotaxis protein